MSPRNFHIRFHIHAQNRLEMTSEANASLPMSLPNAELPLRPNAMSPGSFGMAHYNIHTYIHT